MRQERKFARDETSRLPDAFKKKEELVAKLSR